MNMRTESDNERDGFGRGKFIFVGRAERNQHTTCGVMRWGRSSAMVQRARVLGQRSGSHMQHTRVARRRFKYASDPVTIRGAAEVDDEGVATRGTAR